MFRFFIFPTGGTLLGILIKIISRNHQHAAIKKEDIAVGFPLMVASTLSVIVTTVNDAVRLSASLSNAADHSTISMIQQQEISNRLALAPWITSGMVLGTCSLAWIVGRWGWTSETELDSRIGIALPLAVSALYLIIAAVEGVQ